MDARISRLSVLAAAVVSAAASYRTPNFVVTAPSEAIARQVGEAAERYRRELAIAWFGREMPRWAQPCPVRVKVGRVGAGGTTTFACSHGEVYHWNMVVQGTLDRILDSVLPHEVNHTVLASHFRRPLSRWADEGAATLVEDPAEHARQRRVLERLLRGGGALPLRTLLSLRDYPRNVAALYSQGYSVTAFLVSRAGPARFLAFLDEGQRRGWETALREQYAIRGVEELERQWIAWVRAGSPQEPFGPRAASQALASAPRPRSDIVYRGQTAGEDLFAAPVRPNDAAPTREPRDPREVARGDRRPLASNSPSPRGTRAGLAAVAARPARTRQARRSPTGAKAMRSPRSPSPTPRPAPPPMPGSAPEAPLEPRRPPNPGNHRRARRPSTEIRDMPRR